MTNSGWDRSEKTTISISLFAMCPIRSGQEFQEIAIAIFEPALKVMTTEEMNDFSLLETEIGRGRS